MKHANLCGPCVVTSLQHTPIFEWNNGTTRSQEQIPIRHVEIGLYAQNIETIYEFINEQNWEDLCDPSRNTRIFIKLT